MAGQMQETGPDGGSLASQIARALAGRIVSGALRPGERLLQDEVAQRYRASHVPVREAFQRLASQGLVVIEPRRGVRVARLDPADVLEVAEMRASLEVLALRHAMPGMKPGDIAQATAAIEAGVIEAGVIEAGARKTALEGLEAANRSFHEAITAPCAMPRLLAAIGNLHRASARHLFATWGSLGWQAQSDAEHGAIRDAIEGRRTAAACKLLTAHVLDAGRALAKALRE